MAVSATDSEAIAAATTRHSKGGRSVARASARLLSVTSGVGIEKVSRHPLTRLSPRTFRLPSVQRVFEHAFEYLCILRA
jgi:hypothetical protein